LLRATRRPTAVRRTSVAALAIAILAVAGAATGCAYRFGAAGEDPVPAEVARSGSLRHMAVSPRRRTVRAVLVLDCSASGAAESRAVAPRCSPRRRRRAAHILHVRAGEPLTIVTGEGAATVLVRPLIPGARRLRYAADATPMDPERQHWRARPLPRLGRETRLSISVFSLRTDSGYLLFEVRLRPG
jgi:hypothetical protein